MLINQLTLIGVGLIGGSFARALKQANAVELIVGVDQNAQQLSKAVELGVIDRAESDIESAMKNADAVLLAVPLGAMESVLAMIKPYVTPKMLVSDVGSAKRSVIAAAKNVFTEMPAGFVPGHPIAGTEKSGVEASFSELFQDRCVILTPVDQSADWAVQKLTALWSATGANVVTMSAEHHDEVLAATSHLPHLLAFALVDTLGQMQERAEIFQYAAGGFRDFTRIASSDPDVWRDICLANSDALLATLAKYKQELDTLASAIENQDSGSIEKILRRAKATRDQNVIQ